MLKSTTLPGFGSATGKIAYYIGTDPAIPEIFEEGNSISGTAGSVPIPQPNVYNYPSYGAAFTCQ
jgi:hypothetical protein